MNYKTLMLSIALLSFNAQAVEFISLEKIESIIEKYQPVMNEYMKEHANDTLEEDVKRMKEAVNVLSTSDPDIATKYMFGLINRKAGTVIDVATSSFITRYSCLAVAKDSKKNKTAEGITRIIAICGNTEFKSQKITLELMDIMSNARENATVEDIRKMIEIKETMERGEALYPKLIPANEEFKKLTFSNSNMEK